MSDEWIVTDSKCKVSKGVFTATVEWLLVVDKSPTTTEDTLADVVVARFASVLPFEGTAYPGRPFVSCRGFECSRIRGRMFRFVANYSDENTSEGEEPNENPLLDPPIIKPTASTLTQALHEDRDGKPFLNSAGDPIIDEVVLNYGGFRISANVAGIPSSILSLANTTNRSAITIAGLVIPANAARIIFPNDWLSEVKWKNGIPYYVFSFEIDIDTRNLHYGVKLNAGFRQLVDDKLEAIRNEDGSDISEPVPLDDAGAAIANPTPENVSYVRNKRYPEAEYAILPGVS